MRIDIAAKALMVVAGGCTALMFAAPAMAEPEVPPTLLPPVGETVAEPAQTAAQTVAAPEGVPHLPSPDAPPPGATMDPSVMAGTESPNVSYLRDLWHAVQNQELSGKQALLLGISQRNLNTPIPAQAPGPNVPISPTVPAPVPAPAPVVPLPAPPVG
ncbi:hypothetical protein [Mycolicibacterium diernhoferi]|uniref:Dopamine receptor D4 n=1 Tax=Mycolicibacterium diernhoferi TaxID=1801 RepID=A0A1T3W145_9MYCO|nr:hypothetical protein [Mycolicibacterium diernhoferi]OPE48108.1 hypothetical protein BV510_24145 [Mycolicibacterium diernhoferi]